MEKQSTSKEAIYSDGEDISVSAVNINGKLCDTQPLDSILQDVVAYVEVRTEYENRSQGVAKALEELGARVVPKFYSAVTHVVFRNGRPSTRQRAVKRAVPIVSVLWVEACRQQRAKVDEHLYPILDDSEKTPGRLRRFRSMQPKEFNEELIMKSVERYRKQRRQRERRELRKLLFRSPDADISLTVPDTLPKLADTPEYQSRHSIPDTPLSMRHRRDEGQRKETPERGTQQNGGESPPYMSPLEKRLLERFSLEKKAGADSSSTSAKRSRKELSSSLSSSSSESNTSSVADTSLTRITRSSKTQTSGKAERQVESELQNQKPTLKKRKLYHPVDSCVPQSRLTTPQDTSRAEISGSALLIGNTMPRKGQKSRQSLSCISAASSSLAVIDNDTPIRRRSTRRSCVPALLEGHELACTSNPNKNQLMDEHDHRKAGKSPSQVLSVLKTVVPSRNSIEEFRKEVVKLKRKQGRSQKSGTATATSISSTDGTSKVKRSRNSRTLKSKHTEKYAKSLVMTSLHREEQDIVISIVNKLGGFRLVDTVTEATTHVVCGANRRTLNVLLGIARGCWLLSLEWVIKSLEAGRWLKEGQYEQHEFFPACKVARIEKQKAGLHYKQALFTQSGLMFVAPNAVPAAERLIQLITLCGGNVTTCMRKAHICIGSMERSKIPVVVSEQWLLDSITAHETLPYARYLVAPCRQRSPSPEF